MEIVKSFLVARFSRIQHCSWGSWVVRSPEKIINGSIVVIGQLNEHVRGNIPISLLIAEVLRLFHSQKGCHIRLS